MLRAIFVGFMAIALSGSAPAIAKNEPGQRVENSSWQQVLFIKFKPGKRQRAMEMVDKIFTPAQREAGLHFFALNFETGPWDAMYSYSMPGGPADLASPNSSDKVDWMTFLARRAGGIEAANKIYGEWDALVERQETHIARGFSNP